MPEARWHVIAYKFLRPGRIGPFTGFSWPAPEPGGSSAWVDAGGGRLCHDGVHACRPPDLPYWIGEELWMVELTEPVTEEGRKVVASRGRLARRIDGWTPAVGHELAVACAWRTRDRAVDALRARRLHAQVAGLVWISELADLGSAAAALSESCGVPEAAVAAGYAADAAASAQAAPVMGFAFAATATAYIAAHAAAHALGSADGFTAEREWQAHWLAARLGLE